MIELSVLTAFLSKEKQRKEMIFEISIYYGCWTDIANLFHFSTITVGLFIEYQRKFLFFVLYCLCGLAFRSILIACRNFHCFCSESEADMLIFASRRLFTTGEHMDRRISLDRFRISYFRETLKFLHFDLQRF